jgi:hypothetical protein
VRRATGVHGFYSEGQPTLNGSTIRIRHTTLRRVIPKPVQIICESCNVCSVLLLAIYFMTPVSIAEHLTEVISLSSKFIGLQRDILLLWKT